MASWSNGGRRDEQLHRDREKAGDYTLTATYKTAVLPVPKGAKDNGKGFGPVTVISAPVKLKVVGLPKGKEQGQGVNEWKLVEISAEVSAFNPASARVLEKCGFEQEGYVKKQHMVAGSTPSYGLIR